MKHERDRREISDRAWDIGINPIHPRKLPLQTSTVGNKIIDKRIFFI
ncbi:hypothetical protein [Fischerella sp. JS2]|nr:hypothetical protein [Fischerella sp. JS2]